MRTALLSLVLGASLVACTAHHTRDEVPLEVEVPSAWDTATVAAPDRTFCDALGDPTLEALIAQALTDNLDLLAARARVEQAELVAAMNRASLYPDVSVQGTVTRQEAALPPTIDFGPMTPDTSPTTVWNLSVPVAYEVDLWGRLRAQQEAASLDALAAQAATEAMALTLSAQVTETYLNVVFQRALYDLVQAQITLAEENLQAMQVRFGHGQATTPQLLMQRTQIEGLRAQLALIEATEAQQRVRLAALLGSTDVDASFARTLPAVATPDPGIPADLLRSRPDVYAAELRWRAQDQRLAVAVAERLPTVRITASLSFQSANLADLLDDVFWSVMGAVTQPIFGGDRRNLNIDLQEAGLDELGYAYGQSLLTAMTEVQEALTLGAGQAAHLAVVDEQHAIAADALAQEQSRYALGGSQFLSVLNAQSTLYTLQQSRLQAQRQALSYDVQLCRALGSGSTHTEGSDDE